MNTHVLRRLSLGMVFLLTSCIAGSNADVADADGDAAGGGQTPGASGPNGSQGDGGQPGNANDPNSGVDAALPVLPFEALGPASYVGKVKVLLTGLCATDEEIEAGATDAGLAGLVDTWMAQPQFQDALARFLGIAFQQTGLGPEEIRNFYPYGNPELAEARAYRQMFVRTALYFVNNRLPFNKLMTTNQFMVTPYLLRRMAIKDTFEWDDKGKLYDITRVLDPNLNYTLMPTGGATTIEQFLDVNSPNYMLLPYPAIKAPLTSAECGNCDAALCGFNGSPIKITHGISFEAMTPRLDDSMRGYRTNFQIKPGVPVCTIPYAPNPFPMPSDMTTWRLVTIKVAGPNDATLRARDLPAQRTANTVYLRVPRIGFMTTPSFMGQWSSNRNNESRSTVNQALVIALNRVFDGSDSTMPTDLRTIPTAHADPKSSCYGCHLTMDPMRQYFRQSLTYGWTPQKDTAQTSLPGVFAQGGVVASGGGLQQLGEMLASSPLLAPGWAQKVCMWLNSSPCDERDPELKRIAQEFVANNYDFLKLVKAVATSPLTTYHTSTQTAAKRGVIISIARQEQLCQNLSSRLGVPDLCNLDGTQTVGNFVSAGQVLGAYPATGYNRASVVWAQATGPSLLTRLGLENACSYIAMQVVDNGTTPLFSSRDVKAAVAKMTSQVVGASGDDAATIVDVLTDHYTRAAAQQGVTATQALRSTFVLGCLAPQVSQVGI